MLAQSSELSLRQTREQGPCDASCWESDIIHQGFHIHLQPDKDYQNPIINIPVINFRLCTKNCGDFQMQNSSDQKMNGSLTRSLGAKVTKKSKSNTWQVMNLYFFCLHKESLGIKVKERDFP